MFNQNSINKVNDSMFNELFKKPLYDSYCLSNVPGTILNLFGVKTDKCLPQDTLDFKRTYKKVVLFLLDGFGWNLFDAYYKHSTMLTKMVQDGIASKLTTQFPSTTTCNITTMHSSLSVGESGVYEWFFYEPLIDDVYSPLLYKKARLIDQDAYLDISPELILPHDTIYNKLANRGVSPYIFQYHLYNINPYSEVASRNANVVDFMSLEEGLLSLKDVLKKEEEAYCYFYHSNIDSKSHEFGPYSKETKDEILETFKQLDRFFEEVNQEDTLFLVTADHGQTTMNKENSIYINLEYKEILPYLKTKANGEYIVPCGSFRDLFLHVKEDYLVYVKSILTDQLKGKAEVYLTDELISKGLFGKVTQKLKEKVGNLVILSYPDYGVWWYEENKFTIKHNGMHGGLVKEELEIPFISYSIAE